MRNGICYNKNGECDEERCRCNEDLVTNEYVHKKINIKKSTLVTKKILFFVFVGLVVIGFGYQQYKIVQLDSRDVPQESVNYQPQIDALRADLAKATSSIAATNAKILSTAGFVSKKDFDQLVTETSQAVNFLCSKVGCN